MRRPLALAAVALGVLAATRRPAEGAGTVRREIVVDGATRAYLVHVPETWDRARPLPVVLAFHGAGGDAESMRPTGFESLAATTSALVVYPEAPRATKRYEVDPPAGRESADVRFVDALLERLRERFPVDPRRVFATGFSNGAALCYRLAAERPRVFAAIAPVAGYLPRLAREAPVVPVPVLHVHGGDDGVVAPPGGSPAESSPVATWARWNGATRGPTADVLPGTGRFVARRWSYAGATPRSDAQYVVVEGEGHVWPGGGGGPMTRAIFDFFLAHPLPEPEARPAPAPAVPPARAPGDPPLVGRPLGSLDALRWLTPEGKPVSLADQPLTLLRWWTNRCPFCTGSVPALARVEERFRARGLRMVAVYHPKGAPLGDVEAREYARRLGFSGAIAFDDRWTKYVELRDRGRLHAATSISLLVDAEGVVRWVHPGPEIEAGSRDLAALEALLDRLLPPAR
jgi:polyhydroxybutyrate depolymerase